MQNTAFYDILIFACDFGQYFCNMYMYIMYIVMGHSHPDSKFWPVARHPRQWQLGFPADPDTEPDDTFNLLTIRYNCSWVARISAYDLQIKSSLYNNLSHGKILIGLL